VPTGISSFIGQTLIADEAGEAACPVAALFDLGAVGIEDAVMEIGIGQARRLDQQDLIAADAEAPIGQTSRELGIQVDPLAHGVEDDEVVAQSLHLGEAQFHDGKCPMTARCRSLTTATSRRLQTGGGELLGHFGRLESGIERVAEICAQNLRLAAGIALDQRLDPAGAKPGASDP
jgi:hypothetical protein